MPILKDFVIFVCYKSQTDRQTHTHRPHYTSNNRPHLMLRIAMLPIIITIIIVIHCDLVYTVGTYLFSSNDVKSFFDFGERAFTDRPAE